MTTSVKLALAVMVVAMAANLLTLGGVGDILYNVGDEMANSIFFGSLGQVHGDYYWPISIWLGLAWPPGAFLIFYVLARRHRRTRWSLGICALFLISILVLDVALVALFHLGAASLSADQVIEGHTIIPVN